MIEKNIIKKILRDITRSKQGLKSHDIMHPEREWFIGLSIATAVLGMSVAWSIQQYRFYNDGNFLRDVTPVVNTTVIYREHEVSAALESLTKRGVTYVEMQEFFTTNAIVNPDVEPEEVPTLASSTLPLLDQEPLISPTLPPVETTPLPATPAPL